MIGNETERVSGPTLIEKNRNVHKDRKKAETWKRLRNKRRSLISYEGVRILD